MTDRENHGFTGVDLGNPADTELGSAGEGGADVPTGRDEDGLAEALGGREGDAGARDDSGAASASRGDAADAGSPGGMGGGGGMSNPEQRPNGGVSPVQGAADGARR